MSALQRRGFVLLAVLWVMVGVSVMGVGVALVARRAVGASRNRREALEASWIAEDCLSRARVVVAEVLEGRPTEFGLDSATWASLDDALSASSLVRSRPCHLATSAAGRAINVNTADDELLSRLLRSLAVPPARVDSLVDAILDWRDADDTPRPHGAEWEWYVGHGRAPPRNGPFADVRELARVRGVADVVGFDSLVGVEPGRIALNQAPLPVIAALPGFTKEAVARVAEHRARGAPISDLLAFSAELSPPARAALQAHYADLVQLTTTEPDAWILTSRGTAGHPPVTVTIEVRLVRAGTRAAIVRRRTWIE